MNREPIQNKNIHTRDNRFVATSSYPEATKNAPLQTPTAEISADGLGTPISGEAHDESSRMAEMAHQVKDTAENVAANVQERLSEAGEHARTMGNRIVDGCDSAMTATGSRLEQAGESLRNRPENSTTGRLAVRAGDALASSGHYLQQSGPGDVRLDLENVMRKRPITTLAVGAGIGFLLARAIRRS